MGVPPAPVRVPNQKPLASSVTSVTSVANDKDDNEMIPRAAQRSPMYLFIDVITSCNSMNAGYIYEKVSRSA